MSGSLLIEAVRASGAQLIPIDSEHNAIFQCLPSARSCAGAPAGGCAEILLTASGGRFPEHAIRGTVQGYARPGLRASNWVMGRKISVDSRDADEQGPGAD